MIPVKKLSSRKVKIRPFTPFLIVAVCLLAAVGFSISVESRSSGWFRKDQPSTPQINAERTKNSRSNSVPVNSHTATGTSATFVSPVAPTVTATKTDSLFTDVDLDGKADPGDTLKYTVVIGATGADATGVTFTDTVDPNTTFVAGTLRTTPLARADSYTATGNVRIQVPAPGVLANDSDPDGVGPAISVTAGTFLSAQGGNVTTNADGSFSYNPPAGFEGTDTFTYTLNDNDTPNNTDTGTVSITVSGMIWFINNNAAAGDGRLTNPFNTLAAFQAVNDGVGNHPAANDNIFVYESATDYVGPVTLLNGQKFIGQDATASLASITGITLAPNSDALPATSPGAPIVNITSASAGINLGQNNTLRGFTGGNSAPDINGSGFGTVNISDVTLNGNGQALNLSTGTLNGTFGSISSTNSATTGVSLTSVGGSLTTGSTTVTNPTGIGISVNTSSLTLGFANTSVTGSGGTGVSLTTNTGSITFGDLDISPDAGQRGLLATDNTNTITTTSGTIGTTTGIAVEITRASSTTPLAVALTSVSSNGAANGIVLRNTSGSFSVNGDGTNTAVGGNATGGTIANATGADGAIAGSGVYLDTASNVTLRRMTINGTNQNFGIRGLNVNGVTVEYSTLGGTNGTSTGADEGSIIFDGLLGTSTFTNDSIAGSIEDNFRIRNSSGTSDVTITGSTFTNAPNDNLIIEPSSTANVTAHVTNNTFTGAGGDHFQTATSNSATLTVVFTGNLYSNGFAGSLGGGVTISGGNLGSSEHVNFNISNNGTALNPLVGSVQGGAINVNEGQGGGTWQGQVSNNIIGNAAVANSGAAQSSGIRVENHSTSGTLTAIINGNTIRQWDNGAAINTQAGDAGNATNTGVLNVTVTNNTATNPGTLSQHGFVANIGAGSGSGTAANVACVDVRTNTLDGNVTNGGAGVRTRHREVSQIKIPGYTNTQYNTAAVVTLLTTNNPGSIGPPTASTSGTGPGYTNTTPAGSPCPQPTVPTAPISSDTTSGQIGRNGTGSNNQVLSTSSNNLFRGQGEAIRIGSAVASNSIRQTVDAHMRNHAVGVAAKKIPASNNEPLTKVDSHHAKITKRNDVVALSETRNAPVAVSPITTPVVNKIATRQPVNAMQGKKPRGGIVVKPTVAPLAGETVSHSVGTLLAGKTVHIQFQVTVNNPYNGGATVSNQGTVSGSNFADVLTDDPAAGGANDPTTTPILLTPNISISDAQANEPSSGSAPMLFSVSLSGPAPAGGTSVHYQTADQAPGVGHAVAGVDYTAIPDTTLSFAAGEQFKTITVNILADGPGPEPDETFLVNLSTPTNGVIVDAQGIGTIKQGNAAGTFLISELRTSGPGGAGDDFVELYNNSDVPLVVTASDASGGYGLFKMGADCNATPVLIATIPNGTTIPARGHYLLVGSAYSLANYGGTGAAAGNQTLTSDIDSDRNVGIFNTASLANLSSVTRLDAVGFGANTGGTCDLLREGTTLTPLSGSVLEHSYVRDECGKKGNPATFGPCPTGGGVKDSNVNGDDFIFVDTSAALTPAGQRLGAPGPQNLLSPIVRNSTILALLLDSNIGAPAAPNRVRDLTPVSNGANGTLSIRRRFVNNTGAPVTRLRFRIVDISSISVPGGIADIRALTSTNVVVNGITDNGTCTAAGQPTPCTITVQGTTLETPPAQPIGGAHNSTMSAGTITLGTPLAAGGSINLQFLLGVQQTGSFKFFFNVEALP